MTKTFGYGLRSGYQARRAVKTLSDKKPKKDRVGGTGRSTAYIRLPIEVADFYYNLHPESKSLAGAVTKFLIENANNEEV